MTMESAPARLLKTTTRGELRTKSDLCVTLRAWYVCQTSSRNPTWIPVSSKPKQVEKAKTCSCVKKELYNPCHFPLIPLLFFL